MGLKHATVPCLEAEVDAFSTAEYFGQGLCARLDASVLEARVAVGNALLRAAGAQGPPPAPPTAHLRSEVAPAATTVVGPSGQEGLQVDGLFPDQFDEPDIDRDEFFGINAQLGARLEPCLRTMISRPASPLGST
eukprot:1432638-Pyramimonas_sp.AAC.1